KLPSFGATEALAIARAHDPNIPFILVTGVLGEEVAVEAMKAGITDYILKDRLFRLVPAVERALRETSERALRREAEESVRLAEAKYQKIFENAIEGIFQSTPEGRYLSANSALARILGYDSAEELVRNVTDIGRQVCVDPATREELERQIAERGLVQGFENQIYRRDGTKIWISVNARAVRDADGRVL